MIAIDGESAAAAAEEKPIVWEFMTEKRIRERENGESGSWEVKRGRLEWIVGWESEGIGSHG